ncbi:MAG: cytochrome d ubiquinol oxidase subunit II [Chloroflexi bacterium RBG_16_48_8]|nr:MAG: cytochrome d ubiquinol oxidase subunit II [Chloroflexi bacterium RBG_16_48_8]
MELQTVWFLLITILFTGFFILEGFDYGVGILLPFLGKSDKERRMIINAIGPFWDGNEVWIITAGGAIFAAFPEWYATLFSGFYLALALMLFALIIRGVGFEFRSNEVKPLWRKTWDWLIFTGSLIPALLWGVAMANLLKGLPIDENFTFVGTFWDLLNPYSLISGLAFLSLFILHGAIFLSLKVEGDVSDRAISTAKRLWGPALVWVLVAGGIGLFGTDMVDRLGILSGIFPLVAGLGILAAGWNIGKRQFGSAFIGTVIGIAFSTITLFRGLFPRVMVSSLDPDWSLTITNASSSDYTLKVMTIVALIFVPLVLLYQSWSYWTFRKRIREDTPLEY